MYINIKRNSGTKENETPRTARKYMESSCFGMAWEYLEGTDR